MLIETLTSLGAADLRQGKELEIESIELDDEIDDFARSGPTINVVTEKNDEVFGPRLDLGHKEFQLVSAAMDVAYRENSTAHL